MDKPKTARLFVRGKRYKDGTFPAMNSLKTDMMKNGYPEITLHVGYAVAKGIFFCGNCCDQVTNPPSDFYNGDEFWRCKCGKINFITNKNI